MAEDRHFHWNNDISFCAKDASHIPMTFNIDEVTCKVCSEDGIKHVEARNAELARHAEDAKKHELDIIKRRRLVEKAERERHALSMELVRRRVAAAGHRPT